MESTEPQSADLTAQLDAENSDFATEVTETPVNETRAIEAPALETHSVDTGIVETGAGITQLVAADRAENWGSRRGTSREQASYLPFSARQMRVATVAASLIFALGGTVAVASEHKTVQVNVDGVTREISGFGLRTNDILQAAKLQIHDKDKLNKGLNQRVGDGDEIRVSRAKLQVVEDDGAPTLRWQADDPNVIRAQIKVDGKTFSKPAAPNANLRTLVESTGTQLSPLDRVLMIAESNGQLQIEVQRVSRKVVTTDEETTAEVKKIDDAELSKGKEEVVDPGAPGKTRRFSVLETLNGQVVHQTDSKPYVLLAPRPKVVKVGTKSIGDALGQRVPAGEAQRIAHELVLARGWDEGEFSCLVELWNHESGWNTHAQNPSGAYGIPQALPGSKMASAGPDWENNPRTQIIWGLGYIQGRYGTPCGAWSAFQSKGWY